MWGSKGCPFPQPQATLAETRDPDVQAEPEPASRGPTGRHLAVGTTWHLSFRGPALPPGCPACLPLSIQAQLGGGRGPAARATPSPEKGKTQGLASTSLAGSPLPASTPASSLKGTSAPWLLAWGRGDSIEKPLGS